MSTSDTIDHDEAIEQFCSVTGAGDDRAKSLLEACDWNLELAVNMHVDTDDGRGNDSSSASQASNINAQTNASASSSLSSAALLAGEANNSSNATGASAHRRSAAAGLVDLAEDTEEENDNDDADFDPRRSAARRDGAPSANSSNAARLRLNQQSSSANAAAAARQHQWASNDEVRPPIPPVRQVLVQSPHSFAASDLPPRRYSSRSMAGVSGLGGPHPSSDIYNDAFRDFRAEARWQEMAVEGGGGIGLGESEPTDGHAGGTDAVTPLNAAAGAPATLDALYRPPLDLMFHGSLMSAREKATNQNKWLLVNVQTREEFACQTLNRDLWSHQTVKEIIRTNFVFWQVYHGNYECQKYIQFYNVSSFPHVSIIDPRTGEQMKTWPKTIDHSSFCDSVTEFLAEHPTPDGTINSDSTNNATMKKLRVVKDEDGATNSSEESFPNFKTSSTIPTTPYDQSEEAQLAAAIKASLKETTGQSQQEQKRHDHKSTSSGSAGAHSSERMSIQEEDSYNDLIDYNHEQSQDGVAEAAPVEDYKDYLGSELDKLAVLVIRFPDGSREQFKFPSDSRMKALFLLLASRGYGMKEFNYVTNFPRRNLHELEPTATLNDAKLVSDTIFVERKN